MDHSLAYGLLKSGNLPLLNDEFSSIRGSALSTKLSKHAGKVLGALFHGRFSCFLLRGTIYLWQGCFNKTSFLSLRKVAVAIKLAS